MTGTYKIQCPQCGSRLKLSNTPPPNKKLKCPQCQTSFVASQVRNSDEEPRSHKNPDPASTSGKRNSSGSEVHPAISSRKKAENSEPINIDESEIYDDLPDEGVESDAADFESWSEEEFDETDYEALPPASLPKRSGKSGKVTSKTVSTPAHESTGAPRRWVLPAAIGGGVILLMAVIALMASGVFKSDYEKLHGVWYDIVFNHLRATETQKSSSEVSREAEKIIADIQEKIDPASYFNVLLPEARRKPVVLPEQLKRFPDLKSLIEGMKQDAKAKTTKEVLIAFGIEIYPWLIPVIQRVDAGTASDQEKFLCDALMLHRLLEQLS